MSQVEMLFVSWTVGLALSCWLFFEMAKRSSRAEQLVVRRRVVARSISPKRGGLSDARHS